MKSIGWKAFENCTSLESVTLKEGISNIESNAFYGCTSLKSITIPSSVISIESGAFRSCKNLTNVVISEGVTKIGDDAFIGCNSLSNITIPDSVVDIGERAFAGTGLVNVVLPKNITKIKAYTFQVCKSLKNITIPNGVTEISNDVFNYCTSLQSIMIPESVTYIGSGAFSGCKSLASLSLPDGITRVPDDLVRECDSLESVVLPGSVTYIGERVFDACPKLQYVIFHGTKVQWKEMKHGYSGIWLYHTTVVCNDGNIVYQNGFPVKNDENSITTGTASTSDSKFQATFANAKAGKEYVVLVSRTKYNSLSADNLIYINQITADADGELTVPFITAANAAEMTYVVACAQDDAPVDPDQPDKPGQPDQPGQPDKPGEDKPSSGGDGGGAAIILIGGVAAVAAVAGVVLMMPVKVEGTVKLADQPVANATVQVLKGDTVKAETVTDANGHFTVKVKRGGYTLRVQWTDASGQPVMHTVDFKAPNANLNVAA